LSRCSVASILASSTVQECPLALRVPAKRAIPAGGSQILAAGGKMSNMVWDRFLAVGGLRELDARYY